MHRLLVSRVTSRVRPRSAGCRDCHDGAPAGDDRFYLAGGGSPELLRAALRTAPRRRRYRMTVRARVHHLIVAIQRGEVVTKQVVESVKGQLAYVRKRNPGDAVRLERQLAKD